MYVRNYNSSNITVINSTTSRWISIPVGSFPATLLFDAQSNILYVSNYGSGTVSMIQGIFFAPAYEVSLTQTGLPAASAWSLTVDSRTVTFIGATGAIWLTNGSHSYLIRGPPRFVVTGLAPAGELTIAGVGHSFAFSFVPGRTHSFVVVSNQVPGYLQWCVGLSGGLEKCTYLTRIVFGNLSPGNYSYSVTFASTYGAHAKWFTGRSAPLSGPVVVSSSDRAIRVHFGWLFYVTFSEVGLPAGSVWSVRLNGVTLSSTTNSTVFSEENGSYSYRIGVEPGFSHYQAPRGVRVLNGPAFVTVTFVARSGAMPAPSPQSPTVERLAVVRI